MLQFGESPVLIEVRKPDVSPDLLNAKLPFHSEIETILGPYRGFRGGPETRMPPIFQRGGTHNNRPRGILSAVNDKQFEQIRIASGFIRMLEIDRTGKLARSVRACSQTYADLSKFKPRERGRKVLDQQYERAKLSVARRVEELTSRRYYNRSLPSGVSTADYIKLYTGILSRRNFLESRSQLKWV